MSKSVLFSLAFILSMAFAGTTMSEVLTDPYEVLNKHYEAIGGLEKAKSQKTSHLKGELDLVGTGLKGTFEQWSEIPVMNRQEVDLKILKQVSGDNGKHGWIIDRNGKLQINRDDKSVESRKLQVLMEEYEHLNKSSQVFTVVLNGIDTASGNDCYAVQITNNINSDTVINYYDTSSFIRHKSVNISPENKGTLWFSDYRDVDGILIPFRQDMIQEPPGMRQILQFSTVEMNVPIDRSMFEPPGQDVTDFRFTNGKSAENIPFKFIESHIYLPVEVGGKTRLWVLDTGAGATTIDKAFAKELGLTIEGNVKGQGAGNLVDVSFTTLPAFNIEGLEFDEQSAAVIDVGWLFKRWLGMEIAGILGYDFLSRLVTKVDYANQTLSFFHPDSFNYMGNGVVIPAPVNQSKMMDLPVKVDGKHGGLWSLDLGAGGMGFHYQYASQNGLTEKKAVAGMGFGAGGAHPNQRLLAKTMEFAGFTVNDIEITVPKEKGHGAFGNTDLTGNIGNTLMRHFTLYIDYKKEQVIAEKGDKFGEPVPRDNSGMQVTHIGQDSIQVFFIADNTPAAKAGFQVNDLIVSVNGIKIQNLGGIVAVYDLLRQEPGTSLKFEVTRGGESKKLTLTLGDLYG